MEIKFTAIIVSTFPLTATREDILDKMEPAQECDNLEAVHFV